MVDLTVRVRGPDRCGIFDGGSNVCLVRVRFGAWRVRSNVSSDVGHVYLNLSLSLNVWRIGSC